MPKVIALMRLRYHYVRILASGLLVAPLLLAGCTSTGRDVQFDPMPAARVGESDLDPVLPRGVTDLLRDAEEAFKQANVAQEKGDQEAALRHYTLMLELLVEADLDPSIFYSLRDEFGEILDTSTQHARLYERRHPRDDSGDFHPSGGNNELEVPFPLPERVLAEIEQIQKGYPKSFQRGLDRSYKYNPHMRAEFEKAGLPPELVWMAMVESQYTPKIVSRAGAGGMWQFMRATGRRYDLRIDSYVDERYNWHSATQAAIGYLSDLHQYFDGDWSLAVTAYNMGEGGLERAIASNGGERNFWELIETPPASNRIRLETKKYYPRFLATLIVTSNPERYGFTVSNVSPENTVRVAVKGCYALDDLDEAMGSPAGALARLNPDLLLEITPPSGAYSVAVPRNLTGKFKTALRQVSTIKPGGSHKVRRGETVSAIAARYGVSQRELMRLNNIRSPKRLQAGKTLQIPGYHRGGTGGSAPSTASRTPGGSYTVRRGDTLTEIAQADGVSVRKLQEWNGMGRSTRLHPGDKLHTGPQKRAGTTVQASGGAAHHSVRAGEYPARIAKAYGVPLDDFLAWNGLTKRSTIRAGQKLRVAPKGAAGTKPSAPANGAQPAGTRPITHTVASGDTASGVAAKYRVRTSDLLAWNQMTSKTTLYPGKKLTVYVPAGETAPGAEKTKVAMAGTGDRITHVVASGHNPTTIARRYGVRVNDLFAWNNWSKRHVLHVGDEVVVYKK